MVVKKKSSKKVVKKKKVLKVKGGKVSKPKIPYEIIKVAKLPDDVLKKIKEANKSVDAGYYTVRGRFRRWFDWLNDSFKILTAIRALDYNVVDDVKGRIPKEYHYHIKVLTDAYNRIRGQLYEVENNVHDVLKSIYYYHGKDLNIKEEEIFTKLG